MSNDSSTRAANTIGIGTTLSMRFIVQDKDTVGFLVPGMPRVAATSYLVTIVEMVCYEIAKKLIEPNQITVGRRVEIEHVGPSKVGTTLVVDATLRARVRNLFHFDITIKDAARIVAMALHVRAAVSMQKLLGALG